MNEIAAIENWFKIAPRVGKAADTEEYQLISWLFLRIIGSIYLAAFASLSRICDQLLQAPIPKEIRIGKAFPWQQGLKELGL
jgi:hypothetical protein